MLTEAWAALALLVLVASLGDAWWLSVAALAFGFLLWRRRDRATLLVSAIAAFATAGLWVYLMPLTAGSELVLALLALVSAGIGLLSLRGIRAAASGGVG